MDKAEILRMISTRGHRRNLFVGATIRIGLVVLVWLMISVPRNPSWTISDRPITHILMGLALLWSLLAFGAYYFRKFIVLTTFLSSILVDLGAITILVFATGGPLSPFNALYLFEIVGVFFLGNYWQGMVVSLSAISFMLLINTFALLGILTGPSAFSKNVAFASNSVLMASTAGLLLGLIVYTIVLSAIQSRRVDYLRGQVKTLRKNLQNTGNELMASFHDLESVADRLNDLQISAEQAKNQLIRADKYASIGWVTAGLINEFINPLTSIMTDMEMLLMNRSEKQSQRLRDTGKRVLDNAGRIHTLIKNLTSTIHPGSAENFMAVDINRMIERVASIMRLQAMKNASEITLDLDGSITSVFAIESQIEQMLINLILNSLESIDNRKGKVGISTKKNGQELVLSVEDNGQGIAEGRMERIFEPFFSTRINREGAGLGLYIIKQIVDNHSGRIQVRSREGQGTTFAIHIPLNLPS